MGGGAVTPNWTLGATKDDKHVTRRGEGRRVVWRRTRCMVSMMILCIWIWIGTSVAQASFETTLEDRVRRVRVDGKGKEDNRPGTVAPRYILFCRCDMQRKLCVRTVPLLRVVRRGDQTSARRREDEIRAFTSLVCCRGRLYVCQLLLLLKLLLLEMLKLLRFDRRRGVLGRLVSGDGRHIRRSGATEARRRCKQGLICRPTTGQQP